jgi:hypothetical protein
LKANYQLKKEVLENGCCNSLRKQSLSQWKINQLKSDYDFMLNGLRLFGEMENIKYNDLIETQAKIEKSQEFYIKASEDLRQYSNEEIEEATKVNNASYKRQNRLQKKALQIIKTDSAIFLTLTFSDKVFTEMSKETRKQKITRFLKKTCKSYIANIDYGGKNGREHYHALVVPISDKIDQATYRKMFYDSTIDFERVIISNSKNHDIESTSKKVSKYVSKLTNHAIKETTGQNRIIYSKN